MLKSDRNPQMWLSPLSGGSHFKLVSHRISQSTLMPNACFLFRRGFFQKFFLHPISWGFWLHINLARMPGSRMLFSFLYFVSLMSKVQRALPHGTKDHDCWKPMWIKSLTQLVNGPNFTEYQQPAQVHAGRSREKAYRGSWLTLAQRYPAWPGGDGHLLR